MKILKSSLLYIALGLAASVLTLSTAAREAVAAPKGIKLLKANCVVVVDGIVLPLRGHRYEQGKFRCSASIAVDKKMKDPSMDLSVKLLQKPERPEDKEERGQVEHKFELWSGMKADVEVELNLPENLNGCMPFTLVLEGAGQVRKVQAAPSCGD